MGTVRIIVKPSKFGRVFSVQIQKRFMFIEYWKLVSTHEHLIQAKEMKALIDKGEVEA